MCGREHDRVGYQDVGPNDEERSQPRIPSRGLLSRSSSSVSSLADFARMGLFDKLFGKRQDNADAAWQTPVVQEICITLIRIIPPHWNSVALTLGVPEHGLGKGLSHSISSPEGHKDVVMPTMEVFAATRKLELGWLDRNSTFKKAIISAQRAGEDWSIKSEYEH